MPEISTIAPGDVEIEHTKPGPIIHFFPLDGKHEKLTKELLQGLYLLHHYNNLPDHESISLLKDAEEYAAKFVEKIRFK